jgi:hypothetical protein
MREHISVYIVSKIDISYLKSERCVLNSSYE